MRFNEDEPGVVRSSMVVEYQSFLTGTTDQIAAAHALFEKLGNEFYEKCHDVGLHVQKTIGQVRPMTQQEALQFIPRRFHFDKGGEQLCDTAYVSKKMLTTDESKVTCKLCQKRLAER